MMDDRMVDFKILWINRHGNRTPVLRPITNRAIEHIEGNMIAGGGTWMQSMRGIAEIDTAQAAPELRRLGFIVQETTGAGS